MSAPCGRAVSPALGWGKSLKRRPLPHTPIPLQILRYTHYRTGTKYRSGQLQANAEGGLSERAQRRILEIADEADLRTRAPRGFLQTTACTGPTLGGDRSMPQRDWRLPRPGTLITRRFGDRRLVVKVLRNGFEFEARRYRSLSAIAREVTGTRWNGLLFFGLAERRHE